jgi:intracellular septation protein A
MSDHGVTIHLPSFRELLNHAGRPLLESTLIPLGLFWVLFTQAGFAAGVIATLSWSALAIGRRIVLRKRIPAVLVISTVLLVIRTALGLWTGSAFLYFLQPTAQNFVFALALVGTLWLERPLLAKLCDDFCPFPESLTGHPGIKTFFRRVSLLWACVFLVNGVTTIIVLATQAVGDYLLVSTAGSYSMVALGIGTSLWWFRRSLAGHGIRLRIGGGPAPLITAATITR